MHPNISLTRREAPRGAAPAPRQERKPPPRPATAAEASAVEEEVFGTKGRVLNAEAGARWLVSWCGRVAGEQHGDDDALPTAVCRLLLSPRSDDELAAELFDLLGEGVFEHVGDLLGQRPSLAANLRRLAEGLREADEAARPAMPSYGTTVSVTSESQKLQVKAERKADRRRTKQGGGGGPAEPGDPDADWVSAHGLMALVEEEVERETAHTRIRWGRAASGGCCVGPSSCCCCCCRKRSAL